MLTSKQRAYLRTLSHELPAIFQIGKAGIGEELCLQLSNALRARELVKVHVLDNSAYTAREAAQEIAGILGAELVAVTGAKFVLYKESEEKKKIELP